MAKKKRVVWKILGRNIGTGTGWDELGNHDIIIYDFVPSGGVKLPDCDLGVMFETGRFETYDENGNVNFNVDIIETLHSVEKAS